MKALLIPLLFIAALATSRAAPESGMDADFAWFSTLGFPDVKDLPFVRYDSGASVTIDGKNQELWSNGFLLDETPASARILTLDLMTEEIAKDSKTPDAPPGFAPDDLRGIVEDELSHPPSRMGGFAHYHRSLRGGPQFTQRTHLFVLAWMCQRKGLNDLAAKVYATAENTRDPFLPENPDDSDWPFRAKLERDIGAYEMWRTFIDFGDPKIARRELLARLQALVRRYWHCDHVADAQSIANQLARMVAEDDVHPARTPEEIGKLPPAEQVREWIFRLRDQDGGRFGKSAGGWIGDIFESRDDSPAHQLLKLGTAAVPGLIAALNDPRFTRSASW